MGTHESQSQSESIPPVEVPADALSPDALRSVLESFILREGTDYGVVEISMQQKVENLRRRIANGSAFLIFDPNTESITFLTDSEWRKLKPRQSVERL